MKSIRAYLDEDFFAKKRGEYSEEEWKIKVGMWADYCQLVEKKLFQTGKISKITFNRFSRGGWRIFNFHNHLVAPSTFNRLFDMKEVDMNLFSNAVRKVQEKLNE